MKIILTNGISSSKNYYFSSEENLLNSSSEKWSLSLENIVLKLIFNMVSRWGLFPTWFRNAINFSVDLHVESSFLDVVVLCSMRKKDCKELEYYKTALRKQTTHLKDVKKKKKIKRLDSKKQNRPLKKIW